MTPPPSQVFCTHTQGWLFPVLAPSLIPAASMDAVGAEGRAPPHIQVLLGTSKRDLIGKQVFADVMSEDEVLLASGEAWIQGLVSVRKRGDADACTQRRQRQDRGRCAHTSTHEREAAATRAGEGWFSLSLGRSPP